MTHLRPRAVLCALLPVLSLLSGTNAFVGPAHADHGSKMSSLRAPVLPVVSWQVAHVGPHHRQPFRQRLQGAKKKEEESFSLSFDRAQHKDQVLVRCLLAIAVYMATGVVCFSRIFEKWPIIDSLYFSVVTFTTCGYGDLVPTTEAGKLFAIAFSFAGISIVGALLGYVGGSVVEAERKAVQLTREKANAALMEVFHLKKRKNDKMRQSLREEDNSSFSSSNSGLGTLRKILGSLFAIRTRRDGSKSLIRRVFDTIADSYYIFGPFVALALWIGHAEGWSPITSMYYAMATASTVGWGDYAPTLPKMRLLSLVFIPLAVISLGEILGRIAGYFIRKETNKAEREFLDRRMTLDDLEAMDTDKNGEVDLFEFLTFMLGSMQKVDKEMMDDLKGLFESLDENGSNSIQKEDLILMARKKRDPWSLRRKRISSNKQ